MLAWTYSSNANGGSISLEERPEPTPGDHEITVAVKASGLNRADVLQRMGVYPAPPWAPADILGLEYAGIVKATGSNVHRWSVGDRVMGLVGGGALAQTIKTQADEALAIPIHLDFHQAAALPEAQLTAFDALERLDLNPGDPLLIHAIGSGVGNALLHQAKKRKLNIWGTSRNQWKLDKAKNDGLIHAVLSQNGDFISKLNKNRFKGIVDFVGASYLEQNINSLDKQGKLLILGLLGGTKGHINLGALLRCRGTILSATMRSRPQAERVDLVNRFRSQPEEWLTQCLMPRKLDSVFGYTQLEEAQSQMKTNQNYGKIVLDWRKSI